MYFKKVRTANQYGCFSGPCSCFVNVTSPPRDCKSPRLKCLSPWNFKMITSYYAIFLQKSLGRPRPHALKGVWRNLRHCIINGSSATERNRRRDYAPDRQAFLMYWPMSQSRHVRPRVTEASGIMGLGRIFHSEGWGYTQAFFRG